MTADHNHDASNKHILGPCPACDDWQVDGDAFDPALPTDFEAAIIEHDHDAHPGALEQLMATPLMSDGITLTNVGDLGE